MGRVGRVCGLVGSRRVGRVCGLVGRGGWGGWGGFVGWWGGVGGEGLRVGGEGCVGRVCGLVGRVCVGGGVCAWSVNALQCVEGVCVGEIACTLLVAHIVDACM